MSYLKCSECGKTLENPRARTCGPTCRSKRSRRSRKKRAPGGQKLSDHLGTVSDVVSKRTKDTAHEVLKEEMRPVVREAITSDVLCAINEMVALMPRAVELIRQDLENEADPALRQRAYTLLTRYTLGNPSVAPVSAEQQPAPMSVVFQLPRPGDAPASVDAPVDVVAQEVPEAVKDCQECGGAFPLSAFPDDAARCQECHDELRKRVLERFTK